MNRSPVKTGLYEQRSRATTRRRDRGEEPAHSSDPDEQFRGWLNEHLPLSSLQDIKALDRKRFLQETGNFNVPPGERLRQLAIHAEGEAVLWATQPEGWSILRSIYEYALRFDEPDTWRVQHSMAISALRLLRDRRLEPAVRERVVAQGIEAASRAVELAPEEATTHSILGQWYYELDRLSEALCSFEAGIAADPDYGWPALYRAHTLRDLQRWDEAIQAYDAVPLGFFKGREAFRVDMLKEMRAWCKLQQGDREGALADFLALLTRYETHVGQAHNSLSQGHYLVRAAAGPLRDQLHQRTLALVRQLGSAFECCVQVLES
jgi:tetratricopeptide (TPR) repeat protein